MRNLKEPSSPVSGRAPVSAVPDTPASISEQERRRLPFAVVSIASAASVRERVTISPCHSLAYSTHRVRRQSRVPHRSTTFIVGIVRSSFQVGAP